MAVTNTSVHKMALWINPVLLMIIGYFAKSTLDDLNKKMDDIVQMKVTDANLSGRVDGLEFRVSALEKTASHYSSGYNKSTLDNSKSALVVLAKPEEEYNISHYIKEPITSP